MSVPDLVAAFRQAQIDYEEAIDTVRRVEQEPESAFRDKARTVYLKQCAVRIAAVHYHYCFKNLMEAPVV